METNGVIVLSITGPPYITTFTPCLFTGLLLHEDGTHLLHHLAQLDGHTVVIEHL